MACIMPLYLKCFDCPPKLKVLALQNIERLCKKMDYQYVKTKIIPKLLNIMKDPTIEIRKDAFRALYSILNVIDPLTFSNAILPGIEAGRKAGSDQFINAICNAIYNHLAQHLSPDVIGLKILPVLIPYLNDPSISKG